MATAMGCGDDEGSGGPPPEPEAPSAISLVLENAGTRPVFVTSWSMDRGREPWLSAADAAGTPVGLKQDCTLCPCNVQSCTRCTDDLPGTFALAPGETRAQMFDGTWWTEGTDENNGEVCNVVAEFDEAVHDPAFTVTFCYGFEVRSEDGAESLLDETCETRPMVYGVDTEIRLTVGEDLPAAGETRFTLENKRQRSIFILEQGNCTEILAWSNVFADDRPLSPYAPCGACGCDLGRSCEPGCPDDCLSNVVRELAPGESVSWTWNQRTTFEHAEPEWTCTGVSPAPAGALSVEFCYGNDQSGFEVTGVGCDRVPFDIDQPVVIWQVF